MINLNARTNSKHLLAIAALALTLSACAPGTTPALDAASEDTGRMQVKNEDIVVDTTGVAGITAKRTTSVHALGLLDGLTSVTPALKLVGTIAPPQIAGVPVQASDVVVSGTKAYVAYNTAGATLAGGLDVIDFAISGVPVLKASTTFADTDINKVFVDAAARKVYLTGATSAGETGAILYRYGMDATGLLGATRETKVLRSAADATIPAYAGTSVIKSGNFVYALSGSNGGLSLLNATNLNDVAFTSIADARDLGLGAANNVLVVSGKTATDDAKGRSYAETTGALQASHVDNVTLPGATIDEGKSTIYTGPYGFIASAGAGGAKAVCHDGYTLGTMTAPTVPGLDASITTANAVTFGNGLVYVAQGAAGVLIYSVEKTSLALNCAGYSLVYRGKFTFGAKVSVNNVYYSNGYLVIATGLGGFQIVQVTQSLLSGLLQNI